MFPFLNMGPFCVCYGGTTSPEGDDNCSYGARSEADREQRRNVWTFLPRIAAQCHANVAREAVTERQARRS